MTTEGTRPPDGHGTREVAGRLHVKAGDDTDSYAWTPGVRLRVDEVGPPPDDWPSMLYSVVLRPLDEARTSVRRWCQTATREAPLLHKGDVVTVTGQTPGRVFVELEGRGPERAQYILVDPDYERDFDAWAQAQAAALRARDWAALDVEHLAEEVEELRKTERRAVRSQLRLLCSHSLKWHYQPEKRSESWLGTIREARRQIHEALDEMPTLAGELPALFIAAYQQGRREAAADTDVDLRTLPPQCPWALEAMCTEGWLPPDER
jgi:hypothetical protein